MAEPPHEPAQALWASVIATCAAHAVHAGFDFVWQVPAVPLTLAALVGLAIPPGTWTDQAA